MARMEDAALAFCKSGFCRVENRVKMVFLQRLV
jgi:hypothetical protein